MARNPRKKEGVVNLKKNITFLVLYAIAGLVILPVLAYILLGIIENEFDVGAFLDNVSVGYILGLVTNPEVYKSYFTINPINVACWGLIGYGLVMLLLSNVGPSEKKKYKQVEGYGSHGTSRWQTDKEIKEHYYKGERQGWFLGTIDPTHYVPGKNAAVHAIKNSGELNAQINLVGPPGSNKTTGFLYPNMFHIPDAYRNSEEKPDIIVTDPKGEIFAYTGQYLKNYNYDIHVVDFIHLTYGDAVNVISYVEDAEDIMRVAKGFVSAAGSTEGVTKTGDPIWENGEALLLGALIGFVKEVYPEEEQTFDTIGKIIGSPNLRDPELAEKFFVRHNVEGYAAELWDKFLNLEDKVRSGVVGGLSIMMTLFSLPRVKHVTNRNTVDFRRLGTKKDKPMAIFIQMPDEDRTFSPIVNAIISVLFRTMYKTARETQSRLPNPVYFILEEIANIGKIPNIEELLGTMRGRRIYPMMIWQDLNQMKRMFGDAWEGIIAKCDTQIYLGANDKFTTQYVSEQLGKTTIRTQGTSGGSGGVMSSTKTTRSENYQQRQLLFPDEVKGFDNSAYIMLQRSRHPVSLYKTQYKYWEKDKVLCEPLEIRDFPLLSRLYKKPIPVQEEIAVAAETLPEEKDKEIEQAVIVESVFPLEKEEMLSLSETLVENEAVEIEWDSPAIEEDSEVTTFDVATDYEDEDEDEFEFDSIEPVDSDFLVLPASEIDR